MGSTLLEYIKTIIPTKEYIEKDKELLLEILTLVICKMVKIGDENLKINGKNSHEQFMPPNRKLPAISIKDYLTRLMKYSPCSPECFVSSLVYIDRLTVECGLSVNSYNIHRLLITTLLISTKYLDDIFYNNEFYSQVGGVGLKEMNTLELDFLKLLKFSAFCHIDVFHEYQKEIDNTKQRFINGPNHISNNNISIGSSNNSSSIIVNKIPLPCVGSPTTCSPRRQHIPHSPNSSQMVPQSTNGNNINNSNNNNNNNINNINNSNNAIVPQTNNIITINNNNNNNNDDDDNNTNNNIIINTNSNSNHLNNNATQTQNNNNNIINNNNTNTNNTQNNNNTNNNNNSFSYQRRGSCDYETSTRMSSEFHTNNCAA